MPIRYNIPGMADKRAFESVVESLCEASEGLGRVRDTSRCGHPLPARDAVRQVLRDLRSVFFPGYYGSHDLTPETLRFHVGSTLDQVRKTLETQIVRGLCFVCTQASEGCQPHRCEDRAAELTAAFIQRLPEVRRKLQTDVQAHYDGDPAATSLDEAIFCYPGLEAIMYYRVAHELQSLGIPLIPRIMTEFAHSITGIDIHPGARIGDSFFIDHGTGVVIGETCVIGKNVRIYQGVTLGAKSFPLDEDGNPIKGIDRHPVVEDDVVIYSGATILGRVTIGKGSVIGGNVWLTKSVPPKSQISQAKAK